METSAFVLGTRR